MPKDIKDLFNEVVKHRLASQRQLDELTGALEVLKEPTDLVIIVRKLLIALGEERARAAASEEILDRLIQKAEPWL